MNNLDNSRYQRMNNKWLFLAIVCMVCAVIIYLFWPKLTANSESQGTPSMSTAASMATEQQRLDKIGTLPAHNDPPQLAKRQQVYEQLAVIIKQRTLGHKTPDNEVLGIAQDVVTLTQSGYIPKQDALTTLKFMQRIMPELSQRLAPMTQQIEGL